MSNRFSSAAKKRGVLERREGGGGVRRGGGGEEGGRREGEGKGRWGERKETFLSGLFLRRWHQLE